MADPFSRKWHFEPVAEHTGVMQYTRNDGGADLGGKIKVVRAEVFKVGSAKFAAGLVASGKCSHVSADTPLGQPLEYDANALSQLKAIGVTDSEIKSMSREQAAKIIADDTERRRINLRLAALGWTEEDIAGMTAEHKQQIVDAKTAKE